MANIDFPRQKLSRRKKTQKWGEDCIEAALGLIGLYDRSRRSPRYKKQRNYDLYNGKFDKADLEHVTDPLGLGELAEMPATLQYYDVVSPIFNLLFGEEAKRAFSYVVRSVNEEAISNKEEEKKNKVVEHFQNLMQSAMSEYMKSQGGGEGKSPEEQQKLMEEAKANIPEALKRIQKYFDYDFQDMNESVAHKLLTFFEKEQKLKYKFSKGWEHALLAGEEIYAVDEIANEPIVRNVNPLEFYCILPHNSDFVDSADVIVEDTWMSVNTIIDNYYEDLTPKQIDKLEKEQGNRADLKGQGSLNFAPPEKLTIENRESADAMDIYSYQDQDGNIRVTKVVWKSMRKIGRLTYIDELGKPQETIVSETYKVDELNGESIEWIWISEYWEGTKLGEDIFLNIRPRKHQFRHLDNISVCKSGYVGTVYNATNSQSVSLMDRLVPWIYLYITMWYRLELAISSNQGKIALIDLSLVPDGWDVEKWMYYAQSMKFGFVDSFNEGKKGQSAGKLAGNISNQNKVIDMETGNYIQHHVQLLDFVEQKIHTLSGVTPQRMGAISTSELVGNTQRAVVQSSHITEKLFEVHNETKIRVLETLLNVSKELYKGKTKKFQYVTDELASIVFHVQGDQIAASEYGLFVTNSSNDTAALEALKQLTHAALQNDQISLSDVIQIYNSTSLADTKAKLKQAEKEAKAQEAQMQQQQLQMQQEAEKAKAEMEQAKFQLEIEKENREDARNSEDNRTKLEIARMKMLSDKENMDVNNNQVRDDIDLAKLQLEREKMVRDQNIKEKELELKSKQVNAQAKRNNK
jgi:hypothetical protein